MKQPWAHFDRTVQEIQAMCELVTLTARSYLVRILHQDKAWQGEEWGGVMERREWLSMLLRLRPGEEHLLELFRELAAVRLATRFKIGATVYHYPAFTRHRYEEKDTFVRAKVLSVGESSYTLDDGALVDVDLAFTTPEEARRFFLLEAEEYWVNRKNNPPTPPPQR